jgi:uncharacterized protein YecE (DUF72 family)
MIYVGTAAWSIPKIAEELFPREESHLERYAHVLNAVEINTSFYRDHQPQTYLKWALMTPDYFRFSVKVNKRFTHAKLDFDHEDLKESTQDIMLLGEKLGVLLLQFPAGQIFHSKKMKKFYSTMRDVYQGAIALEARNLSWMDEESLKLMREFKISKVTADPEKCPGKFNGEIEYFRLHGSPEIYKSNYSKKYLKELSMELQRTKKDTWCIFDNTTFGYATINAINLSLTTEKNARKTEILM